MKLTKPALTLALSSFAIFGSVWADSRRELEGQWASGEFSAIYQRAFANSSTQMSDWQDIQFSFESYRGGLSETDRTTFDNKASAALLEWAQLQALPEKDHLTCQIRDVAWNDQKAYLDHHPDGVEAWSETLAIQAVHTLFLWRARELECDSGSREINPRILSLFDQAELNEREIPSSSSVHGNSFLLAYYQESRQLERLAKIQAILRPSFERFNDYVSGSAGSIYGTYALGALVARWPDKVPPAVISSFLSQETIEGSGGNLPYDFKSRLYAGSRRGAAARSVVFHWAMIHAGDRSERRRNLLAHALDDFVLYAPGLILSSLTVGSHAGSDGIAPYYYTPALEHAMQAARWLDQSRSDSTPSRAQALETLIQATLPVQRITQPQMMDGSMGRRIYDLSLIGLALLPN